jgi:hypothetical protein
MFKNVPPDWTPSGDSGSPRFVDHAPGALVVWPEALSGSSVALEKITPAEAVQTGPSNAQAKMTN